MKKILVVEDDMILNSGLCYNIQLNGYSPESAYDAKTSIELINKNNYELIILDVNLQDGNEFDMCSYIRRKSNVPVIFLTACDLDEDVIKGFEIGADDYVTKPFNINIFMKKIEAILRRYDSDKFLDIYRDTNLEIDFSKLTAVVEGKLLNLTPTEGKVLRIFIKENICRIFERFYREDDVSSASGMGIGLYLSRKIISMEGGYIKVDSKKGVGSTFSIFLLR